ncbi:hypothetical protein ACFYQA_08360 [Streptomyces sp. NPDC005774]|uniref:hypothetical protein n=1 Tax=Streptomyces sp. NPDC005774 TaxID=3364728 RepID=UPI0036D08D10
MRTLLRILAVALVLAVPAAVAVAVTHHRLAGTDWTDPTPHRPSPKPTSTVTVTPAPTTSVSPTPTGTPHPWPLGSCITTELQPAPCTPGALRIVGWTGHPSSTPCAGIPETDHIRRTDDYALCLTTH